MGVPFAKVAGNLHQNRKVRRAGRAAREVFVFALCQNALHDGDGTFAASDFTDFEYLADQLVTEVTDVRYGFERAIEFGLLAISGDRVVICGWDDDWSRRPLTNAERQAKYRSAHKVGVTEVTTSALPVTPVVTSNVGEERRGEEIRERATAPVTRVTEAKSRQKWSADVIAKADMLWSLQETLRRESIPNCRALKATPERLDRVCKILAAGNSEDDCAAVLRSVAARVKADASQAQWFNGETTWVPKNFDRELGRVGAASGNGGATPDRVEPMSILTPKGPSRYRGLDLEEETT